MEDDHWNNSAHRGVRVLPYTNIRRCSIRNRRVVPGNPLRLPKQETVDEGVEYSTTGCVEPQYLE
ncbi:hypothetical protein PISMIDRAFT_253468 [Pisolithus microcarpus 441]|uniref:Uncharacterized protein n=1 Tax=Pisolithus microcarpus 441 TaxID=765257 RepID=A0A0C9Z2S7_9AGAM|nr:hypothetical protein PISMIDRAFT_253468 [Pisolithus microcarpus 441]